MLNFLNGIKYFILQNEQNKIEGTISDKPQKLSTSRTTIGNGNSIKR